MSCIGSSRSSRRRFVSLEPVFCLIPRCSRTSPAAHAPGRYSEMARTKPSVEEQRRRRLAEQNREFRRRMQELERADFDRREQPRYEHLPSVCSNVVQFLRPPPPPVFVTHHVYFSLIDHRTGGRQKSFARADLRHSRFVGTHMRRGAAPPASAYEAMDCPKSSLLSVEDNVALLYEAYTRRFQHWYETYVRSEDPGDGSRLVPAGSFHTNYN